MSSEYFRIYCKKKRSNKKLARYEASIFRFARKIQDLDQQLEEAATMDDGTCVPPKVLLARAKRDRLISLSLLPLWDIDLWMPMPTYIKLAHLTCSNKECLRQGKYRYVSHCVLSKYWTHLCDKCVCDQRIRESVLTGEQRDAWFARKLRKPYAAGLVLDADSGRISEPPVAS